MRKLRKLAALCAVFLLSLCLFSATVYAVEETPSPTVPAKETEPPNVTGSIPESSTESAIPTEEVNTVPPDGTGTVIETVTGDDGRMFYTITTPAGNVFYLIIDSARQANNVYFLDAVTERDLLALAEKPDGGSTGESTSAIPGISVNTTPVPQFTASPEPTPDIQTAPEPEENGFNSMSSMILVIAVVLVGGGAGVYFKFIRKRKNADSRNEYEDEEAYEPNIPEAYGEETTDGDDLTGWEDEDV